MDNMASLIYTWRQVPSSPLVLWLFTLWITTLIYFHTYTRKKQKCCPKLKGKYTAAINFYGTEPKIYKGLPKKHEITIILIIKLISEL